VITQGLVERQFVGLRNCGVAVFVLALLGFQGCNEVSEWPTVDPSIESTPVPDSDDAADDPFVMLDLSGLTVLGTNKRRDLEVYDGRGELKQRLDRGRLNNVDGYFEVESRSHFIASSNRTAGSVDIFSKAESESDIRFLRTFPVPLADPYGLCVSSGSIFVGDKEGQVIQYTWSGEALQEIRFESQTEGCVVDELENNLYVGEEGRGIWEIRLSNYQRRLIAEIDKTGMGLVADVEGLDLYQSGNEQYLVASSQGDSSFIVYDLNSGTQLAKFRVGENETIDSVSGTDGLAILEGPLPDFPKGLMVVQDGTNETGSVPAEQGCRWLGWRQVDALLHR